jgi:two-component system response regulator PilR (NtrC family)
LERSKGVVLLVTEDVVQGSILERTLTANGFHVLPATNGEGARRLLSERDVGLVISELALDDMTGLDLMMGAQETSPKLPFLFLDDHGLRVTDDDIRSAGGFGLIMRPFNNVEVLRKVRAILGK